MPAVAPPPVVVKPFADNGDRNTIPVPSQIPITPGAASYTDGFPPLTMLPVPPGLPPDGKDMNGILFDLSAHVAWIQAGGRYYYSAEVAAAGGYPLGAVLTSAVSPSILWMNLLANNTTDPDAGGSDWKLVDFGGTEYEPYEDMGPVSGAVDVDLSLGNTFVMELVGSITLTFSNLPPAGQRQSITLLFKQGGSGSYTVTYSGITVNWSDGAAPVLTTTVGKTDAIQLDFLAAIYCFGGMVAANMD